MISISPFALLFTSLVFVLMLLKIRNTIFKTRWMEKPPLPPGPWKWPLIGNLHNLYGSLPYHCLADLTKKYGPIVYLQLGELSLVVINSAETAKDITKNHDICFSQRPSDISANTLFYNCTDCTFAPYGDYWRQVRKLFVSELLGSKQVQSFRSIREEEVLNACRALSLDAGSPVNISKFLFTSDHLITSRAALGGKCKYEESFMELVEKLVQSLGGFSFADVFPSFSLSKLMSRIRSSRLERAHQQVDKILESIINEHRAAKATTNGEEEAEDLVQVLLNLQDHAGELEFCPTNDNIKAMILDIFLAGVETSSTTAEWAMSEMVKNQRVMKKAQSEVRKIFSKKGKVEEEHLPELEYLKLVIKETLRLHSPAPLIPRECRETCEVNGYQIPAKTKVIINAWAIGRDPSCWTDAQSFYPERFLGNSVDYKGANFELIPFGAGRRICPGMGFAVAKVELLLANLLYHFDWKLPDEMRNEDLDMTESFGITVRRKCDLYLILSPYQSHV